MGIFGGNLNNTDNDLGMITEEFMQEYIENVFFMEASGLPDEQLQKLLESPEIKALEEKGLIGKKTRVTLSKKDDLERRTSMASIQMAKENNDNLYDQLVKNRVKERKLLAAIDRKYSNRAARIAKAAQKSFIKANPIGSVLVK